MKRFSLWAILLLSFCGLADSAYITQSEVSGTPLICNINGLSGCNVVAASPYSHIFGIPLSEYGLLFYGVLFVLVSFELALKDRTLRRVIQYVALFGFFASIAFVLLQVYVINALCIYCMASALVTLLIFLCALMVEPVRRARMHDHHHHTPPPPPPTRTFMMPPLA